MVMLGAHSCFSLRMCGPAAVLACTANPVQSDGSSSYLLVSRAAKTTNH
jgi:hypothetical protein